MADAASISHPRLPGNHDLYRCLIGQSSIRKCDAVTKARGWPQVPRGPSGALLLSFKRARLLETLGLGASRSPDGPQCADWPTGGNRAPGATECPTRERAGATLRIGEPGRVDGGALAARFPHAGQQALAQLRGGLLIRDAAGEVHLLVRVGI